MTTIIIRMKLKILIVSVIPSLMNYFYFNGQKDDIILINNSNNILDIKDCIYILLFMNVIDIKFLEKFNSFSLVNIQLSNKKKLIYMFQIKIKI